MAHPLSADILIIGAGTAGSVVASRLSADPHRRIILVEAGPADADERLHAPAAWPSLIGGAFDWGYVTAPQAALGGRRLAYPRGRVAGGSSSINALGHQRGHSSIFDRWAALGGDGWAFRDLLPLFKAQETFDGGEDDWRGGEGPISVIRPHAADRSDFAAAFLEAAVQAGHARGEDFNGETMVGAAWNQLAIQAGRRSGAATAYLRPVATRPNLRILLNTLALGLAFDGAVCIGAEVMIDGDPTPIRAKETILCAGAIDTPRLLMLAGVGPQTSLTALGIEVRMDAPDVGRHLQDHPLCGVVHASRRSLPATAYNHGEAVVFAHSAPGQAAPDVQIMGVDVPFTTPETGLGPAAGFSLVPCLMTPASRGSVALTAIDPLAPARIDPNYLSAPEDMARFVAAIRMAREIGAQPALAPWSAAEHLPGPAAQSDEDLRDFARRAVTPFFHPVGTCRMGREGRSVVDAGLRVHGVRGLRLADASIMPVIPNAMPNAAVVAIGLKAARLVEEAGL